MTPSSRRRARKRGGAPAERRSRVRPLPALGVRVRFSRVPSLARVRILSLPPRHDRPTLADRTHPHPAPPTQMRRSVGSRRSCATSGGSSRGTVPRTRPPRDRDPPARRRIWAPRSSAPRLERAPRRSRRIATRRSRRSRSDRASSRSPSSRPSARVARTSRRSGRGRARRGATPRRKPPPPPLRRRRSRRRPKAKAKAKAKTKTPRRAPPP
jgi:hypothetical protein